jgi:hypothetical protein
LFSFVSITFFVSCSALVSEVIQDTGLQNGYVLHLVLRQNQPQQVNPNQQQQANNNNLNNPNPNAPFNPLQQNPLDQADPERVFESWRLARVVKLFSIVDSVCLSRSILFVVVISLFFFALVMQIFLLIWSFGNWYLIFAVLLGIFFCCSLAVFFSDRTHSIFFKIVCSVWRFLWCSPLQSSLRSSGTSFCCSHSCSA